MNTTRKIANLWSRLRMEPEASQRAEAAIKAAKEVADYLRKHGATKVLLFGSIVTDDYREGQSDIDIYFEGLGYEEGSALAMKTMDEFPSLPLDIIAEQNTGPRFKEVALKYSQPL